MWSRMLRSRSDFLGWVLLLVLWVIYSVSLNLSFIASSSSETSNGAKAPNDPPLRNVTIDHQPKEPCRIVIENRVDFHYEILESVALRYPLPLEQFRNCNPLLPLEVDFALVQRQKQAVFFNERRGWEEYFQEQLQNKTVARNILQDGYNITRTIHYNQMVWDKFFRYTKKVYYNAVISATCDGVDSFNYRKWLLASPKNYCVFHAATTRHISKFMNRSCWLTPMHAPDCFFIPVDLPKFQQTEPKSFSNPKQHVNICVFGKGKDRQHGLLAEAFATLLPTDVGITLYARSNKNQKQTTEMRNLELLSVYQNWNVSDYVTLVADENKFLEFQKSIATQCHLLLPLIDPALHPDYFPHGVVKRLTGTIIQVIANAIPAVIHADLERIYHDYLLLLPTEDIVVYNNTGSFIQSLDQILHRIRRKRKAASVS